MPNLRTAGLIASAGLLLLVLSAASRARPLVVGHRGFGADSPTNPYPENTLPSVLAAFDAGADLVEIDVQLAADGVVVLWHDKHVPVGGEKKKVSELRADEFPPVISDEGVEAPVPTLDAVLDVALAQAREGKVLDIELKVVDKGRRAALVEAVAAALRARRAARRVVITSFDADALVLAERALPEIETGLLGVFRRRTLRKAAKLAKKGTRIEWVLTSKFSSGLSGKGYVADAHAAGFRVGAWTINEPRDMQRLIRAGFGMLITDRPDLARRLVDFKATPRAPAD